jgi:hypothetical protein
LISLYTTIMAKTHTPETPASPGLEQTEEALSVPSEESPLLQAAGRGVHDASPRSLSERCYSALSAFLDKNAGLLLIVASQLFISATNVSVKYLNSLDEHVPMLEVCDLGRPWG